MVSGITDSLKIFRGHPRTPVVMGNISPKHYFLDCRVFGHSIRFVSPFLVQVYTLPLPNADTTVKTCYFSKRLPPSSSGWLTKPIGAYMQSKISRLSYGYTREEIYHTVTAP
jgi:hypothetical protein